MSSDFRYFWHLLTTKQGVQDPTNKNMELAKKIELRRGAVAQYMAARFFWDEVEAQLAEIVSESGRLVVNRLAGMIQITDQHRRVEEVARFVEQLNQKPSGTPNMLKWFNCSTNRMPKLKEQMNQTASKDDSSVRLAFQYWSADRFSAPSVWFTGSFMNYPSTLMPTGLYPSNRIVQGALTDERQPQKK